jgi:hypothetical protein
MKNENIIIGVLIFVLVGYLVLGSNLGLFSSTGGTVIRNVSSNNVVMGENFVVTYTASGTGKYGVSIVDTVSGGCYFASPINATNYKEVILSDGSLTRTVNVIASGPAALNQPTTCTFSGDYQFGTDAPIKMTDLVITVGAGGTNLTSNCTTGQTVCLGTTYWLCENSQWASKGKVEGKCGYTEEGFSLKDWMIETFNLDPDTSEQTLNLYVTLFYIAIIVIIILIIRTLGGPARTIRKRRK